MEDKTESRASKIITAALTVGALIAAGVWLGRIFSDQGIVASFFYVGLGAGLGKWFHTRNESGESNE